jgi:hypothetical protein
MRRFVFLIAALALAACTEDDPINPGVDPAITLSSDSIAVAIGATSKIIPTISNTTETAVFVSRDTTIAKVDASGTITGLRSGKTVVVASLSNHSSIRDSLIVAVAIPKATALTVLGSGLVSERYTAEVTVAEPYAYTTTWGFRSATGNAVKIWNVTGNTPVLLDSLIIPLAGTTSDIQLSSDNALLVVSFEGGSDDGIAIYDRVNPAKPNLIKRFTTAATRQGVHTVKLSRVNGRHYAFLNLDPRFINGVSLPAKLDIVDITDPANPVEVFVKAMGNPYIHDVFVRDGVLMAALWNTGLTIFDVGGAGHGGSPSNPIELGTVKTKTCRACLQNGSSYVHNVWWFHDPSTGAKKYAFVGEEAPSNLGGFARAAGEVHVVDVSNFNAPQEVATYVPDSTTTTTGSNAGAHNFVMDEPSGILYAAFYNGGVRALDVRGDLGNCLATQKTSDGRCDLLLMGREVGFALNVGAPKYIWGVALQGNNLYASDMPNGIHKINIAPLKR